MSDSDGVFICKGVRLHYERLCLAVRQTAPDQNHTPIQLEALAELQACRAQIAAPFDPQNDKPPSQADRARLTSSSGITILTNPDVTTPESNPIPIRLGSDLVSVAIALSDELNINEVDAAILLYDARTRAARRPDHDVVAAAKEMFTARRRDSLLYLQEIIRAGLNHTEDFSRTDAFMSSLLKERDLLLTDYAVVKNIIDRLNDAFRAIDNPQTPAFRRLLASEECLLLAETLFLLTYTVQLTSTEGGFLFPVLNQIQVIYQRFHSRHNTGSHNSLSAPVFPLTTLPQTDQGPRPNAVDLVRLQSVRNLIFLSWTAALDRSRYHNIYNPRTGSVGVNELLRDPAFVRSTNHVDALQEGERDPIAAIGPALAAAELIGSLFRLAVAVPDEDEAVTMFLRASAFGDALAFLTDEIIEWVQNGAGSLSPDTDLYADVVEDLALDIAEAPRLVAALVQYAQNETQELAANDALESLRSMGTGRGLEKSSFNLLSASPNANIQTGNRSSARTGLLDVSGTRPPTHPKMRRNSRVMTHSSPGGSLPGAFRAKIENNLQGNHRERGRNDVDEARSASGASLVSAVAIFVSKSVSAAPAKLQCDSVGGGMRYWVGIGQSNIGFIPRIGDAVIDMWDTAMKNANASGDVGLAFQLTLQGFLLLLKTTSERRGSPAHAAASLKYLRHGGHPVASLERAAGAISFITDSLSVPNPSTTLDDAEAKALCGILDVISTAAEALEAHGGVMPILEDAGRDLASRLSSFIVLNIPLELRESAIQCLKSLNYSRTVPVLLETLSSDKCALLRHWARTEEASSKTFSVSTSVMGLLTRTLDGTETCSEKTLESIAVCYIIGEVLSFCNRRAYATGAQRWEVIAAASEILVKLLTKNPSSSLSQHIATTLLQPAPGTGSASYAFQTLCRTAGLLNKEEHPSSDSRTSLRLQTEFTGALCGRALLTQVVCLGLGDTFRWMRKAVLHSSRLLSLLMMVSPGRLSKAGIVTVSAVDLMTGEPESLLSASSLVYVPDGFDPILSRAGYSVHLPATILNMLSMAAQRSGVFSAILTKDVPQTGGSASLFRASLSRILLDAPSIIGQLSAESVSFEGEDSLPFEDSVLHSVLRLVEACLGPEGCALPGMFLLGFSADAFRHRSAIEHGVLGALIEVVAGTNPYHVFDDPCRATAATFLEKLVSHTAKNTSSAVLDHIRSISAADSSVRGGGFADEMLMRVLEDLENQERDPVIDFNWSSFATFLSACMKLSTLHVRLFPEHEKHISEMTTSEKSISHGTENGSYKPETFSILPSPGALLDLIARAAIPADPSCAIDALGAWSNLLGMRLSVHSEGTGYAHDALLLDIVMKLLSALSSDSCEAGLGALVSANHGEIASASIFECVAKLSKRFESKGQNSLEYVTEDQMLAIIDGVCRGLVTLSRGGSRSEKARTNLYGTLLSCCHSTGTDLSNTLLSRGLCKRSSDMGAVGVDGLIDVTCSDALFGTTNASKSTAIALISRMVVCEPSRTLHALSAQNRLRRLVIVSFSSLTSPSVQELSDSHGKNLAGERSCAAVVQAVLSLLHSISVTASGGRLLSDAGCIEALTKLLTLFEGDLSWKYNPETTGAYPSTYGEEVPVASMDLTDSNRLVPDVVKNWQKSLLTSLTGVLATAVRCGGENVIEDVVFAIDKGFSVFLKTLRNLHLPDETDLRPVCNLGMTLSRIPAHLVSVAVTCSQLRSNLAHIFGRIIPPMTKTQRLGESGSFLSAGINLTHPTSAKAARRIRIAHPEGGSLYERDTVRARATTLRSIFSSFTEATALPFLFTPILTTSRSDQDVRFPREQSGPPGNLGEVLRIAQAMLREYNRSTNECMHLDRRASGDGRPSIRATAEIEYGLFCEEQYGVHPNALDQGLLRVCLKKESTSVSRHAAVCMRVLEMALIILREYIVNASDIVQGKPVPVSDGRANLADNYNGVRGEMSIEIASSFLASANATIIPFCKDVENVQDGVDSATAGAFSRQGSARRGQVDPREPRLAGVQTCVEWDPGTESLQTFIHMPSSARLTSAPPSYAQAVKSLTFSHVSLNEKLTTCHHLLSSNYYPDPSAAVLQFLSSCLSKGCPNVDDCYAIDQTQNIVQQDFAPQWTLLSQALLRYTRRAHGRFAQRESPLIADAVIIQGGLHLLRGPKILKESVSEALYLIIENTRISRDIHTNTWLFCAVARAEGPRSLLAPLRSAVLSNFVQLFSRESDKGRVAAAAACIASHATPSEMALEMESILVHAIRASLPSFQKKFGPWVLRSDPSLPQAIQFLLRAYAKHPLQQEHRSSEKRPRWEPAQRDAAAFFSFLSQHVHDTMRVDGDTLSWDDKTFRSKMGAICALYMTASENAIYSSALDLADGQEKKARNTFASGNTLLTNSSKTHEILRLILRTTRLTNFEAHGNGKRLQLVFQAIIAIADFSFVVVNDFLPEIMEMFLTLRKQNDICVGMHHRREFFCALLSRYERSRSLNKLVSHLMGNSRVLQSLVPILKHRTVQIALASAFRNLRGGEGQTCLQSLVGKPRSSSTDIIGLTLISSLLLETSSGPLLKLAADTIANDVVDVLLARTADPDSRHCRTHLLASFLLARTAHKTLSTEQTVRVGIFRLAFPSSKQDGSTSREKLESKIIDALSSDAESLNPAELCSNLRCLTALTHYVFRYQNCGDDDKLISRAVRASLKHFRMLTNLNQKPNSATIQQSSLSRSLYDMLSLEAVLPWFGSIGYVLRKHLSELDDEAIEGFLKHSFFFFPAVHPFWRELSEETRCAPKISKVAIIALKELSDRTKCPKRVLICSASRVLETLSILPVPFLNSPNHQDLLDYLLASIKSPCCLESRQYALKAFLKLQNSPEFRTSLLNLCRCQDTRDVLETNRRLLTEPSEKSILSPYKNITAAMRVLASLVPEQLHLFLESEVASVLTAGISRIRTDFETGLKPPRCSTAALCGIAEVLIDLRGKLHTIRAMDMGSSKIQLLEKVTTECIEAVLPVCLKFLSKDCQEKTSLSKVARDTLSAITRGTSPKYGNSFEEFSDAIRNDQIQVCVSCLFHPQEDVQKLAIESLARVSVPGEISRHTLNQIFLTLFDRFFARVRRNLSSILRNDTLPIETVRKDILVVSKLSACCYLSCSTTPMMRNSISDRRYSHSGSDLPAYTDSSFHASMRLLLRLEVFLRIWSLAVQDMPERQLSRFRASGLLSVSDYLVCSLLRSCVRIINADRFWRREDMEKFLLLMKQVADSICSGKSFLENEGTALVAALRICRSAAKRYAALIPITTQIIGLLFGRGLSTENETVLVAVREAVEEICVLTKTWETLSALLADCSTAFTQVVGIECRREAERTVATLFKAVSEPKAQQVLGSLPGSGKEELTHIWQMYSDRLVYSGN